MAVIGQPQPHTFNEPKTYREAIESAERSEWQGAAKDEFGSLVEKGT